MSHPGLRGRSPIHRGSGGPVSAGPSPVSRACPACGPRPASRLARSQFRLQAHLAGFHANGNGQMRLAGADWAVEDEVLVLPDELVALQFFPAKQRRELDMAILVAFKGLVSRESSPFHEAVPLILLSGCKV